MKVKTKNRVALVAVSLILIFIICLVIYLLSTTRETIITADREMTSINILECKSISPKEPFFKTNAEKSLHEIKITFRDDAISKIAYNFTGTYQTAKQASDDRLRSSIDYTLYISDNGLNSNGVSDTFNAIDNTMRIYLVAELQDLNAGMAKFFFISSEEYPRMSGLSNSGLADIYENKGFACEYKNSGQTNK